MDSTFITKSFPGFDALYTLDDPLSNPPYRGRLDNFTEESLAITRAKHVPSSPVIVRHKMGGAPKDFIWTTLVYPVFVSQRVIDLFQDQGFTGWTTYPAVVYAKDGSTIPGYQGLAITGRCGPIDESRSERAFHTTRTGQHPILRGLYFDPESWDGSDLFTTSSLSGWRFVTEKVKRALEKARVRNVEFRRLTEVELTPLSRSQTP